MNLDISANQAYRYLEAMQQMAKSANSKVIFLPATNQTVQEQFAGAAAHHGEPTPGSSKSPMGIMSSAGQEYGAQNHGFQSAINSNVIEHM
jgi:erythrocyte band 7 integral membrane protein